MSGKSPAGPEPPRSVALIREAECIGCARCLPACPVDAILGAPGMMHTVIAAECTGCELCLEPCPVDCIDLRPAPTAANPEDALGAHRSQRETYHEFRLANPDPRLWPTPRPKAGGFSRNAARREIAAAVARVAARRRKTGSEPTSAATSPSRPGP